MSEFNRGILFTIGMAMYGGGMYALGKLKALREEAERWTQYKKKVDKIFKDVEKEIEEKKKEKEKEKEKEN